MTPALRASLVAALCLLAAALPAGGGAAAQGVESARAAAEASARARESARRTALRRWQEQRRRAAAHAGMPSTMYASTPDPAVPVHPFHAPAVAPSVVRIVPKRSVAAEPPVASAAESASEPQRIWLFLGHDEGSGREGFLRVVNHSGQAGTVRIEAVDDAGNAAGPTTLEIGAMQAVHLNSEALEKGDAKKGFDKGIGPGQGDWRLTLTSDLDVEALSYVRTEDGFVTSMHDVIALRDGALQAGFLNPGHNWRQESRLRLVNPGSDDATVRITGTDDAGEASGQVAVDLPAGSAHTYTADELESGAAPGLSGAMGTGAGKWRLRIESAQQVVAMSLLATPTGHLTNLSAPPPPAGEDGTRTVALFLSASERPKRQGFMRVVNRSDQAGTVRIQAFDQSDFAYQPVTLSLAPRQARNFNSHDLETGNANKGLEGSTGSGRGDWRLELTGDLDFEAMAYVRTGEGFVTSMHDLVPATADGLLHRVAFLNPGSNWRQASRLLLVNPGDADAAVTIEGIDDAGAPGGPVRARVPAGRSVSLDSAALEAGADAFEGHFGDGKGKWRLWVTSDRPILVASLLDTPTGDLANLSTAPGRGPDRPAGGDPEARAFRTLASPIVQSKCVNCHVVGGVSGDSRLVFVTDADPDHLAKNLTAIKRLFDTINDDTGDGADYILGKIQGVSHGGGVQVAAGTDEFDDMQRFFGVLDGEDSGDPVSITPASLFDGVAMESARSTLRRAAIIFAGRVPTDAEYESIKGGGAAALRTAIRGLMTGPGFHEFLIRGANDRLLTDRDLQGGWVVFPNLGHFVDFNNLNHEKTVAGDAVWRSWFFDVNFGLARAPLELIAHVVEGDLPYTDILTAEYIMANALAAEAYGATTEFEDAGDVNEFKPSEIVSYYRKCDGHEMVVDVDTHVYVTDPGPCATDYPHSGILNTTVFLKRYPTTATNRNRARSRWTYYHFLGVDVEKSASRTTDPIALADTNNPTMHNPACTVCHSILDPVAGAFQNYGDEGYYRDQWGGLDSLDGLYKEEYGTQQSFEITAPSRSTRQTVSLQATLRAGRELAVLRPRFDPSDGEDIWWNMGIDHITARDAEGRVVTRVELQDVADEQDLCGSDEARIDEETGDEFYEAWFCQQDVLMDIPTDGTYQVEVALWVHAQHEDVANQRRLVDISVGGHQEGDTWYRDMRPPGFDEVLAPSADNSVQWLARRIVGDPRFAEATVKFWWPAIMGSQVAGPPTEGDADFKGRLLASNAQVAEVARLARGFRRGFNGGMAHNLKDLLTEMVLSRWFRSNGLGGDDPVRTVALANAGAKRLLTPEELSRKTVALTGFDWRGRPQSERNPGEKPNWTDPTWEYGLLYGGIDSNGVTRRGRNLTSIMAGVAQRHASATSCPVVMKDFYFVPEGKRNLLGGVDPSVSLGDSELPTSAAERAVRRKLVELHDRLLGIEVDVASPDVQSAYDLFVDVWRTGRDAGDDFRGRQWRCDWWDDSRYFDGIADNLWQTELDERGNETGWWDWDAANKLIWDTDMPDPHHVARTWVVVLAYLMTDPRYLHL